MSNPNEQSKLLRRALRGNAIFSTLSGLVFVFASGSIAEFIGLEYPVIVLATGIGLIVFAVGLFTNAARTEINPLEAKLAVAGDAAWVLGSVFIVALGFLNTTGNWTLAFVSDIVLIFAILQFLGLRRMRVQSPH